MFLYNHTVLRTEKGKRVAKPSTFGFKGGKKREKNETRPEKRETAKHFRASFCVPDVL